MNSDESYQIRKSICGDVPSCAHLTYSGRQVSSPPYLTFAKRIKRLVVLVQGKRHNPIMTIMEMRDGCTYVDGEKIEKWNFVKVIGKGNFAVVWKIQNRETGAYAAAKAIFRTRLDQKYMKYVEAETEILSKIDHPNIVKYLDVILTSCTTIVVTELCETGDLSTWIKMNPDTFVRKHDPRRSSAQAEFLEATHACRPVSAQHRNSPPRSQATQYIGIEKDP